ncbi:MAG: plasmid pRiA4b ORF-3 family protein [Tissierellales bacterium]|nr:plasmid pRiA4b ORF-3 family protein [Tissierellales bacterium]
MISSRSKKKFTQIDSKVLRDSIIDQENPGSILHDFNATVEFIQANTINITKSTNFFSLKHLAQINENLSRPIKIDLKRPQKKSFPNIMGLYLLLRGIGLLEIEQTDSNKIARINPKILELWKHLNDTEAYFALLEVWLIRTNPRDLLDEYNPPYEILLTTCFEFWAQIPNSGLKIDKNRAYSLKYVPGLYNVSMLELFGLIDILHGEPENNKGWNIKNIQRTRFGDAFFRFIFEKLINSKDYFQFCALNTKEIKYDVPFGQLQKYFKSFFPEWESNLIIPQPAFQHGTHIFKVSLGNIWRIIAIDSNMTLDDLSFTILDAFNFDRDHLYAFYFRDHFGNSVEISCPFSEEPPFTDEFKIGEIPIEIGSVIRFVYDFGDYWEFEILLQEIKTTDIKLEYPKTIEKHGKAPKQYLSWDEEDDSW